ncbi:hypothetical protein ALC62_01513, partial [Cyphomyrmex costatus]
RIDAAQILTQNSKLQQLLSKRKRRIRDQPFQRTFTIVLPLHLGRRSANVIPRKVGGRARQGVSIIFAEMRFRGMNKWGEEGGGEEIARDALQTDSSTLARKVYREIATWARVFRARHDVSAPPRVIPQEDEEIAGSIMYTNEKIKRHYITNDLYRTCSTSERSDTPRRQLYAGKVGEQIGDRRGAAAAAARDGRRGPKRTGQRAS